MIIHSGVFTAHPVYKIQINEDSITPIDEIVVPGGEVQEMEVDSSAISKKDLSIKYAEHKNIYESGQDKVEEANITTENYNLMKEQINGEGEKFNEHNQ